MRKFRYKLIFCLPCLKCTSTVFDLNESYSLISLMLVHINIFFIIVAAETLSENVETKETLLEAATKEETEPLGSSHDTSEEIVADIPDPGMTKIFIELSSSVEIT